MFMFPLKNIARKGLIATGAIILNTQEATLNDIGK